jgi:hypothetical protein
MPKPRSRVRYCADISGMVRGPVLLLAVSTGGSGSLPAHLAVAAAFPHRGYRRGRGT